MGCSPDYRNGNPFHMQIVPRLALAALALLVSGFSFTPGASAQSASPINPSARGLGSAEMDRIRTPVYRSPDYAPVYDDRGRRVGTIETRHGPTGDEHILRDRRWAPKLRVETR